MNNIDVACKEIKCFPFISLNVNQSKTCLELQLKSLVRNLFYIVHVFNTNKISRLKCQHMVMGIKINLKKQNLNKYNCHCTKFVPVLTFKTWRSSNISSNIRTFYVGYIFTTGTRAIQYRLVFHTFSFHYVHKRDCTCNRISETKRTLASPLPCLAI